MGIYSGTICYLIFSYLDIKKSLSTEDSIQLSRDPNQSSFIISLNNIKGNNKKNKTILTMLFSIFTISYYTICYLTSNI
jgi:hypothetical protein